MEINRTTVVVKKQGMLQSKLDDEYVMLSMEKGEYYGLNAVASRIWDMLDHEQTVAAMIDVLLHEYSVDPEQCAREVIAFLEVLHKKQMIEVK